MQSHWSLEVVVTTAIGRDVASSSTAGKRQQTDTGDTAYSRYATANNPALVVSGEGHHLAGVNENCGDAKTRPCSNEIINSGYYTT